MNGASFLWITFVWRGVREVLRERKGSVTDFTKSGSILGSGAETGFWWF